MSYVLTQIEGQQERTSFLKKIDWMLIYVLVAITIIGLINLFSATHGSQDIALFDLFYKQIFYFSIGWLLFVALTFINPAIFENISIILYILNLLAIFYVTIYGKVALGAQRWIKLGFFNYQPSETMKIIIILVLAKVLNNIPYHSRGMELRQLIIPLGILILPVIFILKQPDLGTSLLLLFIGGSMIIFYGVKKSIFFTSVLLIMIAIPLAWKFVLREYQKQRVYTFLSPDSDPRGSGYNSIQSKIAVGSGQIFGKGYKQGTQSKFEFLPERQTDFIFSVLSEEHGFVGSISVIILFVILLIIATRIAATAIDRYQALLAIGLISYLFWHIVINIGMVLGLLPIVGVPLLLYSYGGSSLLTTMVALGLLSAIAYRRYIF